MIIREAQLEDISKMQIVRSSVKENILSNPNLISYEDYDEYITGRGKGWVCEIAVEIVGFAIADLKEDSIWALFVHPKYEKQGIGKELHDTMMRWYFHQNKARAWLTTSPGTRAEEFYRKAGWKAVGLKENGEIKFEMGIEDWKQRNK